MAFTLITIAFMLAYMAKGGWLARLPYVGFHFSNGGFLESAGKTLIPVILVLSVALLFAPWWQAGLFSMAWLYCRSSMGEEAGAVGDYKENWGKYIDNKEFGSSYGIKKALQWGLSWGALMAAVSGSAWFILAAGTFPICYFIGSSIYRYIHNDKGWRYAEPIYGAVIGLAAAHWLTSWS